MKPPKRGKTIFIIGGFLFFFGLVFGLVGWSSIKSEQRYEREGATVQGTVDSKYMEEKWDKDRKSRSTYYYVKYRFAPAGGTEISSSSSVGSDTYAALNEGSSVQIQYLPAEPGTNRVAQEASWVLGIVFTLIGLLVGGGGLGAIVYEIKKRRLAARLMREGMLVEAEVKSVGPGSLSINNVQQWKLKYAFKDMMGREVIAETSHMPPDQAQQWETGAKGKVRYDKENPQQNIWIGR